MVLNNKTFKFQVCVHMFIECKDSDSPFVFLQTDKSEIDKETVEGMEYRSTCFHGRRNNPQTQ